MFLLDLNPEKAARYLAKPELQYYNDIFSKTIYFVDSNFSGWIRENTTINNWVIRFADEIYNMRNFWENEKHIAKYPKIPPSITTEKGEFRFPVPKECVGKVFRFNHGLKLTTNIIQKINNKKNSILETLSNYRFLYCNKKYPKHYFMDGYPDWYIIPNRLLVETYDPKTKIYYRVEQDTDQKVHILKSLLGGPYKEIMDVPDCLGDILFAISRGNVHVPY